MSYYGVIDFHQTAEYRRGLRQLEAWHDQCRRKRLGIVKVRFCPKCGVPLSDENSKKNGCAWYCSDCYREDQKKQWERRKAKMMAERAAKESV